MQKTCQFILAACCIAYYSDAMSEPEVNGHFAAEIHMENIPSTDHLSFDSQGNLYTGREDFTSQYLKINKVSKDLDHTAFGPKIYDPDSVIVDKQGLISTYGPDSVLVAGLPGQITQISPDGSQSSVLYRSIGKNPQQMVFDSTGRLLYVDCFSNTLSVISGGTPYTLARFARTTCPAGVAVDPYDNIYVTDYFSDNLIKLGPDGTVLNYNFSSGFSRPDTLAFDFSGKFGSFLFIASRFEGTIHSIDIQTGEKKLFASGFNTLYGLTFGPDNCLYASEMRESTIWKICPDQRELLIDIKPGNSENVVNPNSRGKLPVAILGSDSLNVFDLDIHSATFGVTGVEKSLSHYAHSTHTDFNSDGHMDIMVYFYTQSTGVDHSTTELFLKVNNLSGLSMQGSDSISTPSNCEHRSTSYSLKPSMLRNTTQLSNTPINPKQTKTIAEFNPRSTRGYFEVGNILSNFEVSNKLDTTEHVHTPNNIEPNNTLENSELNNTQSSIEHNDEPMHFENKEILSHCKHTDETGHFEHGDKPCPFEYGGNINHCRHGKKTDKLSLLTPL